MPPQLGPQYDLAARLTYLEQRLARLEQNGLGQAFSSTQSDGSPGLAIQQATTASGATVTRWYQGPNTSRDPNTGLHPALMYIGQLVDGVTHTPLDNGVIVFYPDEAHQMVNLSPNGVQLFGNDGGQIFSNDTTSGAGLARPYLPYPHPGPTDALKWPTTSAGSWGEIARSLVNWQHPRVYVTGSVYAPTGVTGDAHVVLRDSNFNTLVTGATHTASNGGFANFGEYLTLPSGNNGQFGYISVEAQVSGGTGQVYADTQGIYGVQS